MTTIQVPAELLQNVTEYIKVASQEAAANANKIKGLTQKLAAAEKSAATTSVPVKLSKEKAAEAAQVLVDAGLLSIEKKASMTEVLQDPVNLQNALVQTVRLYRQRPLGVVEKTASVDSNSKNKRDEAKKNFASSIGVR